jgi:DNA polymerase-3 subunit beta
VKLSTPTADLLAQLQTVTRVASTRVPGQVLSGVMISAPEDSPPELLATDAEVGLRVPLNATVERSGATVIPARLLHDVVRTLSAERTTLELRSAEQDLEVICGSATFHLRTLRTDDFPTLPAPAADTHITLPTATFVQTVSQVARSASRDETRPVLTGILMSASAQQLRMVATDSYRLSVKEAQLEAPLQGGLEANVPARALQELSRIAQHDAADSLTVSVNQGQVVFELGGTVLSSRLIDGQFPNYRQLLPESVEHELSLSTGELAEVVRRVSLLAQRNAPVRLSFRAGELTVSAQTPDVGEASETLPVPFDGGELEIGFNPEFLRDGLDSVESEELVLKLISPLRPGLIESPDGTFIYLIMPIRLNP